MSTPGAPEGHGFGAVFQAEIAPRVDTLEYERRRTRGSILRRVLVLAVLVPLAAGIAWYLDPATDLVWIAVALGIAVAALLTAPWWVPAPRRRFRQAFRDALVEPVCRALGDLAYRREADGAFDPEPFARYGVVPAFDRAALEDYFAGTHRGTAFRMVEARLDRRDAKRRRVFEGLMFEIAVPVPFGCRVLLSHDPARIGGAVAALFRGREAAQVQRIDTGLPEVEAQYEIYTDDPDEAMRLLSPEFLRSMLALAKAHRQAALSGAFADGRFLLAIPTADDLFEPGSLFRRVTPARLEREARDLAAEVAIPLAVIDYLHGAGRDT